MSFPPPPPPPEWATNIPGRVGSTFKVHSDKGKASAALSYHFPDTDVQLLHWDGTQWNVEFEYIVHENCDRCHQPYLGRYISSRGRGPQWQRDVICGACELAEEVEDYLNSNVSHLPNVYGYKMPAFNRAKTIPGFIDNWNELTDRVARAKAERERQKRIIR